MKSRTLTCITAMTLFVALVVPVWLAAQDRAQEKTTIHHHYKLIDVGTFGGPSTFIMEEEQMLLNNGTLTGESDTSIPDPYAPNCFVAECFVQHAFRWQDGVLTDLGALPGGSSSNSNWINSRGWIGDKCGSRSFFLRWARNPVASISVEERSYARLGHLGRAGCLRPIYQQAWTGSRVL